MDERVGAATDNLVKDGSIDNFSCALVQSTTDFLVSEYNILRKEIDVYHNHQQGFLNFTLLLFTGKLALLGTLLSQPQQTIIEFIYIFLLFPLIFTLLSTLYTDKTIRIIRIADYLHNYLRIKANSLVSNNVFQWEIYKRKTTLFNKKIALLLDRVRWWIFIIPSLVSVSVFLVLHINSPWKAIEIFLFAIDSICMFISFIVMYITDETLGIKCSLKHDLDNVNE